MAVDPKCVTVSLLHMLQYLFSSYIAVLERCSPHTHMGTHIPSIHLSLPVYFVYYGHQGRPSTNSGVSNYGRIIMLISYSPTENRKQRQTLYSCSSFFFESTIKISFILLLSKWKGRYMHVCVPRRLRRRCVGVRKHYTSHSMSCWVRDKVWHHMTGCCFVIHSTGPISVTSFDDTHPNLL